MADVMPGTTSNGTPAVGQRRRLLAAPGEHERVAALEPHDRVAPARPRSTSSALISSCAIVTCPGALPTLIRSAPAGARSSSASTESRSYTTTSARRSTSSARTVSRPGSPGPGAHQVDGHVQRARRRPARQWPRCWNSSSITWSTSDASDRRRTSRNCAALGVRRVARRPRGPRGRPRTWRQVASTMPRSSADAWPCARTPRRDRDGCRVRARRGRARTRQTPQQWTMSAATAFVVGPSGRSFTRSSPSRSATASIWSNARRT